VNLKIEGEEAVTCRMPGLVDFEARGNLVPLAEKEGS
jgi:hypothetical protein